MPDSTKPEPVARAHSFGRYRVTKPLGAGAMGEVYQAVDDVLGREVAIKTLRGASGLAARFIDERFRNEARAIAQLAHPGVVQVFDIDLAADPPYLVMERVAGPALSNRLESGPLPVDELATLGIQIARALAAAHAANVVHRDVKPSNILGAGPGTWKLADFGVAHAPDSSLTMTGQFVGSPAYAAPEALVKGMSTPAGDVYGLGATLYQAASGAWPRIEAGGAPLAPIPPLAARAPHVPAHIAGAIDRAVAIDSEQRPTASELADLLARAAMQSTAAPAPARPASGSPLRLRRWVIAGTLVLAVVIAIAMRDDKRAAAPAGAAAHDEPIPGQIQVRWPPDMNRKMAKDWDKLVEHLYDRDYERASERLDAWEQRHGETAETRSLREQLDRLPEDVFRDGHRRKRER